MSDLGPLCAQERTSKALVKKCPVAEGPRTDGVICSRHGSSGAPASLPPPDNLVINAMHLGGEVLVSELRSTVADDDIAIGSVADRCLLSGVIQTSHFKGVRTVFDPERTPNSGFA